MGKPRTTYHFLTDDDVQRLMLTTLYAAGDDGASKDEMAAVCEWADNVKMNSGLLENVLAGCMTCRIVDGEPTFQMTEKGNREAEAMIAEARK